MAENKETFPLNFHEDFRPRAEPWLKSQLSVPYGGDCGWVIRQRQRGMLLTLTIEQAEVWAKDFLDSRLKGTPFVITFSEGANWDWDVQIESWEPSGRVITMFSSDHLCRIVTRMVEVTPNVELNGWPHGWHLPVCKVRRFA